MKMFDKWFGNKSFLVQMVDKEDPEQTESYSIDVDKTLDRLLEGTLIVMGAYFVMSTGRQILIGHFASSGGGASLAPVFNNMPSIAPIIAPVINASSNVSMGGTMHKIVRCIETGEYLGTVTESAAKLGVSLAKMSKHLNNWDGYDHIHNLHYEIAGMGTH